MHHIIFVLYFVKLLDYVGKWQNIVIHCKSPENTYMELYVYNEIGGHTEIKAVTS